MKGHGPGSRASMRTDIFCFECFLSFVGENLRGSFQQNIHQLFRCIYDMLIHQNECIAGFGNTLWSAILFYFCLGSVWLLMGLLLFVPLTSSVVRYSWHK